MIRLNLSSSLLTSPSIPREFTILTALNLLSGPIAWIVIDNMWVHITDVKVIFPNLNIYLIYSAESAWSESVEDPKLLRGHWDHTVGEGPHPSRDQPGLQDVPVVNFVVRGQHDPRPRPRRPPFGLLDGREEMLFSLGLNLEVLHQCEKLLIKSRISFLLLPESTPLIPLFISQFPVNTFRVLMQ